MLKRKLFIPLLLILSLVIFTGCSEGNQLTLEYFVNEDGSGKVKIDFESNLNTEEKLHRKSSVDQFIKEESTGQEFLLNKKVEEIIEKSTGVERWADLNYKFAEEESSSSDDPRYSVKAIAYFKNITEVDLEGIPDLEVQNFQDLIVSYKDQIGTSGEYEKIIDLNSNIFTDKNKTPYSGVVCAKELRSKRIANISKVKNANLDGAFWSFKDGNLSYKTYFKASHPTFENELIQKSKFKKRTL